MRQKVVRLTLVAGVTMLALLLLLVAFDGKKKDDRADDRPKKATANSEPSVPRLNVPPAYDTRRGWDVAAPSPDYAITGTSDGAGRPERIGYLERVGPDRFRLRTLDATTGKRGWSGRPWRPLSSPDRFPRLLSVGKDDQEYFVTWSYGKLDTDPLKPPDSVVSLDIYRADDGSRERVMVPWTDSPTVSGAGPGILISDGKATSAVVDPADAGVVKVPRGSLGYPKGCANCRELTEVRATTDKGLLVSGAKEFWVRGSWFSRKSAPKSTEPTSGVPASVVHGSGSGFVLAKWQKKKGSKDAATHEVWAVHDTSTGKTLAQARCRKPAIAPGDDPRLVASPDGRYLIAGRLAFDLDEKTAYCFEEPDGTDPLTLTTVTDQGVAYGATSARDTTDALAGGGSPLQVDLKTGTPEALAANVRLPNGETAGAGLFRWTDAKDVPHLTGYARRDRGVS
ncbi:hypothetical protein ACIOJD_10000 [Streptomyces sp. NPDC088116]|uniref:hypothetical protein n=1 Tax=Streptomyces sp. NPDC088116 TaxID=3365825 RepID=UPI0037FCA332